ncbi:CTL-like protein DDB_G0274487 isoform X2 [Oryza brachyantha]|uniref:CTL-like protein DDB_G0274487 isoform X2 n=1 Tax=Oryza brachyantha TaxID=4533 RepID=UPI001ADD169E|nr:CTL-like protein DDB_G0274487 isoform X2 [Oryza brachyantha]
MGAADNSGPRQDAPERGRGGGGGRAPEGEPEAKEREVKVVVVDEPPGAPVARLQAQRPLAPLQVTTQAPPPLIPVASGGVEPPPQVATFQPVLQTPPQVAFASLNSRVYTNGITLCVFLVHLAAATFAVGFFVFRAVKDIMQHPRSRNARRERSLLRGWLPPVEGAVVLSIVLAFAWQKAVRAWPRAMVRVILWSGFGVTLAVGALLMCFSMPATVGLGVAMVMFSIGTGLYACWATRRVAFTEQVFERAVQPVDKFRGLNGPAYLMVAAGFVWISVWCVAVIGAANYRFPGLTILGLVLSLMWTAEVMRNVANLTASRVIALYYLRGMQSSVQFSFQRALSYNLGSACLGSLFVPTIEALRILARGLNLLEGEDEFMFSCAHCCLHVMNAVFEFGNSWAFVHIAAYGRGFVQASRSTWEQFERRPGMPALVDSDITSSVCFLTGVTSGALCVALAGSWTFATHRRYTATVSLLAFFVGYLMTRIGMALPQACVGCYYVCYAENPMSRLFDRTIPDRLRKMEEGRDPLVPTPRFPHQPA